MTKELPNMENSDYSHYNNLTLDEVLERIRKEDDFLDAGSHNMFIYDHVKSLERFYSEYAAKWLPQNEIILIATQYQTFDVVDRALYKSGIDVTKHVDEGRLRIIDAQQGYSSDDPYGVFKLAKILVQRAKKEDKHGVTGISDLGSFIGFRKMDELMRYELSCPGHYEDEMLRTVCCYHEADFHRLSPKDKRSYIIITIKA